LAGQVHPILILLVFFMNNYIMADLEPLKLSILIGTTAHAAADRISRLQPDDDKALRIYANVLAVYAVHAYLQWLEIDSSLEESESLHPVVAMFGDVADLLLPGLGSLECRLVDRDAEVVHLPSAKVERLGCVVLRMAGGWDDIEDLTELEIVGFAPSLAPEISVASLAATDALLELIQGLSAKPAVVADAVEIDAISVTITPEARPLLERIGELLPQLSIATIAQKFDELFQTEDHPDAFFSDWLEGILRGDGVGSPQFARGLKQSDGEPNALDHLSAEDLQRISRKLQKLSYKLANVWK
jgi:hypothetical protein